MEILSRIVCILLLIVVIYQDYRYRAVSWIIFPLLFVCIFLWGTSHNNFLIIVERVVLNSLFLGAQFLLVYVYFSVKQGIWAHLGDKYIGPGDLVFLIAITPSLSFPLFISFIILGLLVTLLLYAILHGLFRSVNKDFPIPFAGAMGLLFLALCMMQLISPHLAHYIKGLCSSLFGEFGIII